MQVSIINLIHRTVAISDVIIEEGNHCTQSCLLLHFNVLTSKVRIVCPPTLIIYTCSCSVCGPTGKDIPVRSMRIC